MNFKRLLQAGLAIFGLIGPNGLQAHGSFDRAPEFGREKYHGTDGAFGKPRGTPRRAHQQCFKMARGFPAARSWFKAVEQGVNTVRGFEKARRARLSRWVPTPAISEFAAV